MRFSVFTTLALAACAGTSSTTVTKPTDKDPSVQADPGPVVTGLFAAKGQEQATRVIDRGDLYLRPALPLSHDDVLTSLHIKLVNETSVPDADLRAAANASRDQLGIVDQALYGWTLSIRNTENGDMPSTDFNEQAQMIIITMNQSLLPFAGPHEFTHALAGPTARAHMPVAMNEFMATAAELYQPPGADQNPFTYQILNRPILSTSKNPNGEDDTMRDQGAPLDGLRYELLRAAGKQIGPAAYHTLAHQIWSLAMAADHKLRADDFQPLFAEAGLGDCVLFTHSTEPGVYVDVIVNTQHMPMVLTKYIDGQGQETVPDAPLTLTWRKDGQAIAQFQSRSTPVFTDDASTLYSSDMDEYVVTLGNLTYSYKIDARSTSSP